MQIRLFSFACTSLHWVLYLDWKMRQLRYTWAKLGKTLIRILTVNHFQPLKTFNSEPSVRGTLLSLSTVARNGGIFVVYLLGSYLSWRDVSLVCSIFPIITFIAICFVMPNSSYSNFSIRSIRILNTFCFSFWRFPSRLIGCYQKSVQKMHNNHYSGYEGGLARLLFKMNSKNFKRTLNWWMHVRHVLKKRSHAHIQRQPFAIN